MVFTTEDVNSSPSAACCNRGCFPFRSFLRLILKLGRESMRREVEIEFAVKLNPDRTGVFYLLQIRPMVDNKMMLDEDLTEIPDEKTLIRSHNAIGQGVSNEVYDVVYVKTDDYSAYNNPAIADEIDRINRRFLEEGRNYVLVGPGRWGSSDPWLRRSGEMAQHFSRPRHCGVRVDELPCRPQPRHTLLPKP